MSRPSLDRREPVLFNIILFDAEILYIYISYIYISISSIGCHLIHKDTAIFSSLSLFFF